jgi:hypothetical protein
MPVPPLDIDGALVARALSLDVADFRRLMDTGKVTVLCERGTGDDSGCYRASFYHAGQRARFVRDRSGQWQPA